jgi:hypothetical protein
VLLNAGATRGRSGHPYPGAFERLVTVHRRARAFYVRRTAVISMLVTSHSRAVDYLRRVAESSDSTAVDAVELLKMDADGGSMAAITPTAHPPDIEQFRVSIGLGRGGDSANLFDQKRCRLRTTSNASLPAHHGGRKT